MSWSKIEKIETESGWHVNLCGANNEIVFTSEVYETEQSANKAVEWIRKFASDSTLITKRL